MKFKVGDLVRWKNQRDLLGGAVVAVVEPGLLPHDLGYIRAGSGQLIREAESYVVSARKITPDGRPLSQPMEYWPEAGMLEPLTLGGSHEA